MTRFCWPFALSNRVFSCYDSQLGHTDFFLASSYRVAQVIQQAQIQCLSALAPYPTVTSWTRKNSSHFCDVCPLSLSSDLTTAAATTSLKMVQKQDSSLTSYFLYLPLVAGPESVHSNGRRECEHRLWLILSPHNHQSKYCTHLLKATYLSNILTLNCNGSSFVRENLCHLFSSKASAMLFPLFCNLLCVL